MQEPRAANDFGEVVHGVYRSSFPDVEHHVKNLRGIRSIIKLSDTPYENSEETYIRNNRINVIRPLFPRDHLRHTPVFPRVEPGGNAHFDEIDRILTLILDTNNHPILIHGDNGKHATGCVVGCFRRLQGWDPADIMQEYRLFAGGDARHRDESFFCVYQPGNQILDLGSRRNVTAWSSSRATSPTRTYSAPRDEDRSSTGRPAW